MKIEFTKDIPFLFIEKGDRFHVYINTDNLKYIKIGRMCVYLKKRELLGYFKYLKEKQIEKCRYCGK